MNVPEKVLQGRTSAWSASVDSVWPLLVYIIDCCTRDTPVSWTHTAHLFHSELQTLLRSASEHSLKCHPAGGQLWSREGAPGSPERAAGLPVSLGRDTASSSEYPPPPGNGGGGGHSTEGGAHTGNTGYTSVQPTPVHALGQCGGGKDAQKVAGASRGGGRAGYARHQHPAIHPPKKRGGATHAKTSSKTTKNGQSTFSVGGTSSRWAARDLGERTGRSIPDTHVTPTSHFFW